jgi:hypothetical protein
MDLASRSVVGWAMQPTLDQSLTHHALQMVVLLQWCGQVQ